MTMTLDMKILILIYEFEFKIKARYQYSKQLALQPHITVTRKLKLSEGTACKGTRTDQLHLMETPKCKLNTKILLAMERA